MSNEKLVRSGVFNSSIRQVYTWFESEFTKYSEKPLRVFPVNNPSNLRSVESELKKPDGETETLQYPYMLVTVGDISVDGERAGAKKNRATGGLLIGRDEHNGIGFVEDLRPINVAIGFSLHSDSFDDITDMAHVLLLAYPAVSFYLEANTGFLFYTRLEFQESFSTPQADSEVGQQFVFESFVTLRTYLGVAKEVRLIRELKLGMYETPPEKQDPFYLDVRQQKPLETQKISFTDYYDTSKGAFNSRYRRS